MENHLKIATMECNKTDLFIKELLQTKIEKRHVLYSRKTGALRISNMILRGGVATISRISKIAIKSSVISDVTFNMFDHCTSTKVLMATLTACLHRREPR